MKKRRARAASLCVSGIALALAMVAACSSFKEGAGSTDGGTNEDSPANEADSGNVTDGASTDSKSPVKDATSDTSSPPCEAGACPIEVLADHLKQATVVTVDANNVYFAEEGTATGNVSQCPKAGCGAAGPIALGPGFVSGIASDGANVYWNDFSGGQIVSCAIGGCGDTPKTVAPGQPQAEGASYDGVNLYWATAGNIMTCVPPTCASPVTLATGQTAVTMPTSETNVVYWLTNANGGGVFDCAAAGCASTPTKLGPGIGGSVFAKDLKVYWTSGNSVVSCGVGGCVMPFTIGQSSAPQGIGTDGATVYWLDFTDEVLYSCPITGCASVGGNVKFATGQMGQPGANVFVDGDYVYWTSAEQVLRRHK